MAGLSSCSWLRSNTVVHICPNIFSRVALGGSLCALNRISATVLICIKHHFKSSAPVLPYIPSPLIHSDPEWFLADSLAEHRICLVSVKSIHFSCASFAPPLAGFLLFLFSLVYLASRVWQKEIPTAWGGLQRGRSRALLKADVDFLPLPLPLWLIIMCILVEMK